MENNELEVTVLGDEFSPSKTMNRRIRKFFGLSKTDKVDFTKPEAPTEEILKNLLCEPLTLPTMQGQYVCVIHHDGGLVSSQACDTRALAQASALLYLLTQQNSD